MFKTIEIKNDYEYKGLNLKYIQIVYMELSNQLCVKFLFLEFSKYVLETNIMFYNVLSTFNFDDLFFTIKKQILAENKHQCILHNWEKIKDIINRELAPFILKNYGF